LRGAEEVLVVHPPHARVKVDRQHCLEVDLPRVWTALELLPHYVVVEGVASTLQEEMISNTMVLELEALVFVKEARAQHALGAHQVVELVLAA